MRTLCSAVFLAGCMLLLAVVPASSAVVDTVQAEANDTLVNGVGYPPTAVNNLWAGGWFRIRGVDFGTEGKTWVNLVGGSKDPYPSSKVILYLDSLDTLTGASAIDTITLHWGSESKENLSQLKSAVTGVHDLYVLSKEGGVIIDLLAFHTFYPKTIDAFSLIEFENYDVARDPMPQGNVQGEVTITNFWLSSWVGFRGVVFGSTPVDSITIGGLYKNWAASYPLYIVLDNPDTLVGKVVARLGMGHFYMNYRFRLDSAITGTHDVYFISLVGAGDGYELGYFTFGTNKKDVVASRPRNLDLKPVSSATIRSTPRGIDFSVPQGTRSISVYRADGSRVTKSLVFARQGSLDIGLAAGTYVVEVAGPQGSIRQPLVVGR